jgi:deglycase
MSERLNGFRVAILATDFFQDSELLEPRKALEDAGATTFVIAPHPGEIKGEKGNEVTTSVKVDMTLPEADPQQFDALLLPGGEKNAAALRNETLAQDFVRHMNQMHRPIAVICHGGWLLVSANLVKGRHMTSYPAIREDFEKAGAFWSDKEVMRDGNIVSSRKPSDIPRFNQEMLNLFIDTHAHARAAA